MSVKRSSWNPMTQIGHVCVFYATNRLTAIYQKFKCVWDIWEAEKIWEAKLPSYSDNLIILLWTKRRWEYNKKMLKFNISLHAIRWDDEFFPTFKCLDHENGLPAFSFLKFQLRIRIEILRLWKKISQSNIYSQIQPPMCARTRQKTDRDKKSIIVNLNSWLFLDV